MIYITYLIIPLIFLTNQIPPNHNKKQPLISIQPHHTQKQKVYREPLSGDVYIMDIYYE